MFRPNVKLLYLKKPKFKASNFGVHCQQRVMQLPIPGKSCHKLGSCALVQRGPSGQEAGNRTSMDSGL